MPYQLTLDDNQVAVLSHALDLYSRLGMGQLEELAALFRNHDSLDPWTLDLAKHLLIVLKEHLFGLAGASSYGIRNPNVPDRFRIAWDMQKVLAHQVWRDQENPRPHVVDADEPQSSVPDQPLAIIQKVV